MTGTWRDWVVCCALALLVGSGCLTKRAEVQSEAVRDRGSGGEKAQFKEFLDKVNEYEKLRNSLRDGIPPAAKKATAAQIQTHQEMLAAKIQEARKDAKPGDIFTAESKRAFRQEIERTYSGERAKKIDRTIAQGEPVKLDLYVNKPYPEKIPITTVPPTLLQRLPKLPKRIEYRVVGEDLVLEDMESRLVIDIFSGAFPNAPPHT